jgi:hypothetical protein
VGNTIGAVVDGQGVPRTLAFERAEEILVYVRITGATGSFAQPDVAAAIVAAHPRGVGQKVIVNRLESAAFAISGYEDHAAFEISTDGVNYGTANYLTANYQIALLDVSRVTFV